MVHALLDSGVELRRADVFIIEIFCRQVSKLRDYRREIARLHDDAESLKTFQSLEAEMIPSICETSQSLLMPGEILARYLGPSGDSQTGDKC